MRRRERASGKRAWVALVALSWPLTVVACGWNPRKPFERDAPQVREAIAAFDAGDAHAASSVLQDYLSTGPCAEGSIGTPDRLRERADGTFDLGLALFRLGEAYGRRFGEEEMDAGQDETLAQRRRSEIQCALRVVRAVADDPKQPAELRARAHYLEGNLSFLIAEYDEAVTAYDATLALTPGQLDGGDAVGRDAAWNRAIALRRKEDKKDAGQPDASNDGGGEGGANDGGGDASSGDSGGGDSGGGGGDSGGGGNDGGDKPDAGSSGENDAGANNAEHDAGGPPPPSRASQDERILEQLESAPTLQQEAARKQAGKRHVRGMADK